MSVKNPTYPAGGLEKSAMFGFQMSIDSVNDLKVAQVLRFNWMKW